jgi:hypothetical protein
MGKLLLNKNQIPHRPKTPHTTGGAGEADAGQGAGHDAGLDAGQDAGQGANRANPDRDDLDNFNLGRAYHPNYGVVGSEVGIEEYTNIKRI